MAEVEAPPAADPPTPPTDHSPQSELDQEALLRKLEEQNRFALLSPFE